MRLCSKDFNPPTPHGVGLRGLVRYRLELPRISIHPPRMGWDLQKGLQGATEKYISIHPPRMGWDGSTKPGEKRKKRFQSTHPAWGGTRQVYQCRAWRRISIHPPRMGWDFLPFLWSPSTARFQSTHPAWGGTLWDCPQGISSGISIHPPRMGWDIRSGLLGNTEAIISIHPPRMGWDLSKMIFCHRDRISIHPPRMGWDRMSISKTMLSI